MNSNILPIPLPGRSLDALGALMLFFLAAALCLFVLLIVTLGGNTPFETRLYCVKKIVPLGEVNLFFRSVCFYHYNIKCLVIINISLVFLSFIFFPLPNRPATKGASAEKILAISIRLHLWF